MKKTNYNRSEIMKKMHRLIKAYGMSKSEALTKAWRMAKLEILSGELFILNAYSPAGGASNIMAQNAIREHNTAVNALTSKISALKAEIYPTVVTERKVKLSNPTISVTFDKETGKYTETVIDSLTQTSEYLDVHAYNAA